MGEPNDPRLKGTFEKAKNILNRMPNKKEFVLESEAEAFAEQLAAKWQNTAKSTVGVV
jgi:hypothetical protein